jgi:hypothetical protein
MSYYAKAKLYEQKFVFKPNQIAIENLETVSLVNQLGILIN